MALQDEVMLLREVPLFAGVQVAHLQVLAFSSRKETIKAGQDLIRAGERSASGWLIRKGAAEAFCEENGDQRKLARLERGAFCGELALVANLPHRLTVRAVSSVAALRIPHELFLRVCGEFPEFGQQVLANLMRQFSRSMAELAQVREAFEQARAFSRKGQK